MTHDGMGVCKVEGFPIFVENALKGEKADIKIVKVNKSFGFGRLIEITSESPFRKRPICDHFSECGGCNLMHMNYQMQLDFKRYRTRQTLKRLGKIETEVNETVGMTNPYYYRNKTIIPFGEENGKMVSGLYRKRSHEIVDMKKCFIAPKTATDIVKFMKNVFVELNIPAYNEEIGSGVIRYLQIRNSYKFDDTSIVIVTKTPKLPKKDIIIKKIINKFDNVVSIVHNYNPKDGNRVLGKKSKVIYGEDFIRDEINDVHFKISHRSFYQVNPEQTESLYAKALEYAELNENDIVIDAYCGIGTIGLSAANQVKTVLGVDVVKKAISDANQNAENNNIKNTKFVVGKAENVIKSWKNFKISTLFIDPPRKGVHKEFLETLVSMQIPKVVYISCNVSTLARDLNYLKSQGYEVLETTPFDMFPQTSHIETVTKLRLTKQG
ncbi:MAG: 23S rRNA (uracil(1939)-C(5))-methyltransferase RlmD [Candidatus Izimaplasma sp.]|nr:23S rRNA (uracil(1939)-C(5))-methyltransferase RlmD [Candidatus Izimaplasma bacterium]